MKVLITGGHFSPAYSVIEELQKIHADIHIVGRKYPFEGDTASYSYEYQVSQELKIPFSELRTGRLQRKITRHTILSLLSVLTGFRQAYQLLKEIKPDVVLTFGGYLALPVAISARMQQIPIVTHEQTQGLGLSNKVIAKIADTVCIAFPDTKKKISHPHVVVTGNPMRKSIYTVNKTFSHPKNIPLLYITGGSTGSHAINRIIGQALPQLLTKYVIIHQSGDNAFNDFSFLEKTKATLSPSLQERYILQKFIFPSHIGYVYKTADVVIARSGVNTVLELIACNKPSILIPLPHGQTGEQMQNAKLIKKIGLGEIVPQNTLTPEVLIKTIDSVITHIENYHISQSIIDTYIYTDAANRIVRELTAQYEKAKDKTK